MDYWLRLEVPDSIDLFGRKYFLQKSAALNFQKTEKVKTGFENIGLDRARWVADEHIDCRIPRNVYDGLTSGECIMITQWEYNNLKEKTASDGWRLLDSLLETLNKKDDGIFEIRNGCIIYTPPNPTNDRPRDSGEEVKNKP